MRSQTKISSGWLRRPSVRLSSNPVVNRYPITFTLLIGTGTTVRLPIGYWDLPGEEFTRNTPFEPYSYIYSAAWASICTLISRLRAHSIGVIVDFHALPGGSNCRDHSGTNEAVESFFSSAFYRQIGVRCVEFVALQSAAGLELVGLQLVNEPNDYGLNLVEWYDEAIDAVSAIDATLPVVVADAENLRKVIEYCLKKNTAFPVKPTCPVLIDTHFYWCFTDLDKQKSPQEIIKEVPAVLSPLDGKQGSVVDRGAVQVIVGEYSNALSEDSWEKAGDTPREELVKMFGASQSLRYQDHAGGAFFWAWEMDWMPGGEWGFKAQSNPENRMIFPPRHAFTHERDMLNLLVRAQSRKDERMSRAVDQHHAYYEHLAPNVPAEHWMYENGWKVGYQDAYAFFEGFGTEAVRWGNKIGSLELWVLKRVRESGFRGTFVWEFEQGVRRGINDFNAVAGI